MFGTIFTIVLLAIAGMVVLTLVRGSFFTVEQETVRMVQTFGKFTRVAYAGLNFKIPLVQQTTKPLTLRTVPHNVKVESITSDKVSVILTISIQSAVIPERAADAQYKLSDAAGQMEAFVFDAVRSTVPGMDLDHVFQNKDEIAQEVATELTSDMAQFGYKILKALVTEVEPDAKVKAAMNDINSAERERTAAAARGEAAKTLTIKNAEADAERKRLQGMGVAAERTEIAKGLKDSAGLIQEALGQGIDPEHIMDILLTTQAYDTMRDVAGGAKSTVVFMPNSARGLAELVSGNSVGSIVADKTKESNKAA